MPVRKLVLSLAVLLLFSSFALAQGTYTQIDVPGAQRTDCFGIDSAGDISGTYSDATGFHGFLRNGTTFTSIDYPGSSGGTSLSGLNDEGQIVGSEDNASAGFLYDMRTGTFTPVNYPGATATLPFSINNAGTVAGYFMDNQGGFGGFELISSTYHRVLPPGGGRTFVYGVSGTGKVVGVSRFFFARFMFIGFSFDQGKYQQLTIPNAPNAVLYGINNAGNALVGGYTPSSGETGFFYQNQTLQSLQFPGGHNTTAYGVNDAGNVVGVFLDATGTDHCFLWTPPAAAGKK